jgi:predicted metal-dependent phosphoesterase TrpH
MKELKADLHIHTCLSPCAELEMVPTAIVREARARGLDMIGVCDHNSAENVGAVVRAGRRESVFVVPGMEITSREEVHILGLLPSEENAIHLQAIVYENLTGENDEDTFGLQVVVDEWNEVLGTETRLLIGATSLTLEDVVEAIHRAGGLAVASHIDREGFSLVGQLGFIPPGLKLDALEVSSRSPFKSWEDYTVITSSDAHRLEDIGKVSTSFYARDLNFSEIEKALNREDGRSVTIN